MKKRIIETVRTLRLLNDDKEIGSNLFLWSFIKLFTGHQQLKQAAAALTYHTLFAIVPVTALMVGVAKIMGYGDAFREKVDILFAGQENIANGLLSFADSYLSNRDMNYWLGAIIGLVLLLYSVFSIFQTIDSSFNMLWNLKRHSLKKQIKVFLFVLLIPFAAIFLLAVWLSISSFFSDGLFHEINIFVLTTSIYIAALFVAYKFIPNTKVNWQHAAVAATFCGGVFAIMQYSGSLIMGMFSNYRNIYGDLASLMLFILWIYFSWTICLAGSRWNHLLQEGDRLDMENKFKGMSHNYRKFLAMLLIERIENETGNNRFTGYTMGTVMNRAYNMPPYITSHLIDELIQRGVIILDDDEQCRLNNRYRNQAIGRLSVMLEHAGPSNSTIEENLVIDGKAGKLRDFVVYGKDNGCSTELLTHFLDK